MRELRQQPSHQKRDQIADGTDDERITDRRWQRILHEVGVLSEEPSEITETDQCRKIDRIEIGERQKRGYDDQQNDKREKDNQIRHQKCVRGVPFFRSCQYEILTHHHHPKSTA